MKRVLIITYYWPPAGGISVLRALKIVKYLRTFGWEPVVYTAKNAHYPAYDDGGFKDIPDKLEVVKGEIIEPFGLFKFLTGRKKEESLNSIVQVRTKKNNLLDNLGIWIRGNLFIPDARSLWIKPSVKKLSKYLDSNPVDVIFSDGPPHTNNRIAYHLAKKYNIPWLADFQDPWTQADYYQMMKITKWGHKIHRKQERAIFDTAKKITIASPSWKEELEHIGAKEVDVIYYGYDEDDFSNLKDRSNNNTFDIVHIGLLGIDRYPENFGSILEQVVTDKPIRLLLAGQVDIEVEENLKKVASTKIEIKNLGFIKRKEALQLAVDADLLLLPLNKAENAKGRLPGKLYEYLRTYKPILALGIDGDAAKIIRECNSGACFEYNEVKKITSYIRSLYKQEITVTPDRSAVVKYSNENQTKRLAFYLDQISSSNES